MEQQETDKITFGRVRFSGDRVLWIILAILAIVSLLVIYSSTASMAYKLAGGDTSRYIVKQLFFLSLGAAVTYVVHKFNYQVYARFAGVAFLGALVLMVLTFFVGVSLNDASRWLTIPFTGFTFQPSDFLRVTVIMVLARQLAKKQSVISKLQILPPFSIAAWKKDRKRCMDIVTKNTLPLLLPVVLACGSIFFSNFSTSAITFFTCLVMLYLGRVRMRELCRLVMLVLVALSVVLTIMIVFKIGRAETWMNRIVNFALPTERVESGRSDDNLQIEQAKIAIASGGIIGKGPGMSTQRANLPHSYSDFAYAFIVEEYGLVVAGAILMLYLAIFFRTIIVFQRCGTAFPSLLVLGLGLMIVMQAIVNMMVSVGLFPVTGQTLPIISLGGSSIIFTSMAFGMILGVSRQTAEQTLSAPREESLFE